MADATCAVGTCTLAAKTRGLCGGHYVRWWRTGDVQADRPLRGRTPDGHRWCARCRKMLPVESFQPNRSRPNGVDSYCKPCGASLRSTRYRPRIREQQRRWRHSNPDRAAEYDRRWASQNPAKRRAKHARLKAADPERYRLYAKVGDHRRRARELAAPGAATDEQLRQRWHVYGGLCWMCGGPADVMDHVKPLAKGGSNWPANLRPACTRCNRRKLARWPFPLVTARGNHESRRRAAGDVPQADPVDL